MTATTGYVKTALEESGLVGDYVIQRDYFQDADPAPKTILLQPASPGNIDSHMIDQSFISVMVMTASNGYLDDIEADAEAIKQFFNSNPAISVPIFNFRVSADIMPFKPSDNRFGYMMTIECMRSL